MILRYSLSSLFSRVVLPMQAENILPALGEPAVKREKTTNNAKQSNLQTHTFTSPAQVGQVYPTSQSPTPSPPRLRPTYVWCIISCDVMLNYHSAKLVLESSEDYLNLFRGAHHLCWELHKWQFFCKPFHVMTGHKN